MTQSCHQDTPFWSSCCMYMKNEFEVAANYGDAMLVSLTFLSDFVHFPKPRSKNGVQVGASRGSIVVVPNSHVTESE